MPGTTDRVEVYLEIGQNRVFAGALDWPGWCRSGRDEESAIRALFESGPRYAEILRPTQLGLRPPGDLSALVVIERLKGTGTTDFGAPGVPPSGDTRPVDTTVLKRLEAVLDACWLAFDSAVKAAAGRELRKGPRGGGRDLTTIVQHVLGADAAYLSALGWQHPSTESTNPEEALIHTRQAIREGLAAAVAGQIPERGPRGRLHWGPRYFVRRVAWHVLDHAWEIEDRLQGG